MEKRISRAEQDAGARTAAEASLIQIAFAGHNRPGDLGEHEPVIEDLRSAFQLIGAAGVQRARLLTGLASGADQLAASAWKEAGLGPVHAVFPFLDEGADIEIGPGGMAQTATWLDGAGAEAAGRHPHLRQTRWLIAPADLLVVVWTGAPPRGAGGTADAVRLALDHGLPVLWVRPGEPRLLRLIIPPEPDQDFDFAEFLEGLLERGGPNLEVATPERLAEVLNLQHASARPPHAAAAPATKLDDWLHSWLWKTYATFRRWVGGRANIPFEPTPLPPDLAEQPGFQRLSAVYGAADHRANRLSAVHRSEQIVLLVGMVLAAIVGSSPTVWPAIKLYAVAFELGLGVGALVIWYSANRARQHERWSETRRLAEQLRLERAGWAIGVTLLRARSSPTALDDGDLTRNVVREVGLPVGRFDAARERAWGDWAISELVGGEAAYHRSVSVRDGRISHRLHIVEDITFALFLVILTGFLIIYLWAKAQHIHLPHWAGGVVIMAGTIVPAVAAATMALEAKLEFSEQANRSRMIATRLESLARDLGERPSFEAIQRAVRTAMRWKVAEADQWREGAGRRRLFRP